MGWVAWASPRVRSKFFLVLLLVSGITAYSDTFPVTAEERLLEEVSQLKESIPSFQNPELNSRLKKVEALVDENRLSEALDQVLRIKVRLIGLTESAFPHIKDFETWRDLGFIHKGKDIQDFFFAMVVVLGHLKEDLNRSVDTQEPIGLLTRYSLLRSLTSAMKIRQESSLYSFRNQFEPLCNELLDGLMALDRVRVPESWVNRAQVLSRKVEALTNQFYTIKRIESLSATALILSALKRQGPIAGTAFVYDAIDGVIASIKKSLNNVGSEKSDEKSPYVSLFSGQAAKFESSAQFQIVKFELASRVLENRCKKSKENCEQAVTVRKKLTVLTQSKSEPEFWVKTQELLVDLNQVAQGGLKPTEIKEDAEFLAQVAPDALRFKSQNVIGVFALSVSKMLQEFDENSPTWNKLDPYSQNRSKETLQKVLNALQVTGQHVARISDAKDLEVFANSLTMLRWVCASAVEAAVLRSKTGPKYAAILEEVANSFAQRNGALTEANFAALRQLLQVERREGIHRAWVNKDTVTTAALSALLVGEAVSILYTGGASAAAMPATLSALRAVMYAGQAIGWIARATIAASASSNVIDRYRSEGWVGLANTETALDILTVIAIMPRLPIVTPTNQLATSTVGKMGQWMLRKGGYVQFTVGHLSSQLMAAYSGYQWIFAEHIAKEYRQKGMEVSVSEIRARATVGLLVSGFVLWKDKQALMNARKLNFDQGKAFEARLADSRMSGRLKKMLNPIAAGRSFYNARPSWFRAIGGIGYGLGYVGADYLLVNEAILFAHANPDFNYMNHIEKENPFPKLEEGESAVAMVGINPLDTLLFFGANAEFTHHREKELYGDQYGLDTFNTPENLLQKLEQYAQAHGPIRYLKIMTHGRPGMLYTPLADEMHGEQAVGLEIVNKADNGYINEPWLESKKKNIQERMAKVFAPGARIVLWACLTGANYDPPLWGESKEPLDIGDRFLNSLGQAFLVNKGSIDASTHILMGVESVFGSALSLAGTNGRRAEEKFRRPIIPIFRLDGSTEEPSPKELSNLPPQFITMKDLSWRSLGITASGPDDLSELNQASYTGNRVKFVLMNLHGIWWKYGYRLEGPWWHSWYKHVEF